MCQALHSGLHIRFFHSVFITPLQVADTISNLQVRVQFEPQTDLPVFRSFAKAQD